MYPKDLRYYKEHEWVRAGKDGVATVGISHFAQEQLGDIVYVALPEVGAKFQAFAKFGEIESVKTVSDLFLPVTGEVVALNEKLKDSPELVNKEPYGDGWMLRLKMSNPAEFAALMTADQYEALVSKAH